MLNTLRKFKHASIRKINAATMHLAERHVVNKTNCQVISGPLANTRLVNRHVFGSHIPKLLGTYELEIQESLDTFLQLRPATVCNIGGAEGYYGVGCARAPSVKHSIIYEGLELGQTLIKANANENNVTEKIDVKGFCDEAELHSLLSECSIDLMLIDIEGAELDILSSRNINALKRTNLIIESHDFCRPKCIEILTERFKASHEVNVIQSRERSGDDITTKLRLPEFIKTRLIDEKRPGVMFWAVCTAKENQH